MRRIVFEIPGEVLCETGMSKAEALACAGKAVALQYYTRNRVSLGYCATIAGVDKETFIRRLGENNISIFRFDDRDEFQEEMLNA